MKLPGQDMHLIHPLDASSIKQFTGMQTLSLMTVFRVAVGPAMSLVPASGKFLTDPDTGTSKRELSKLFNEQLRGLKSLRSCAAQLESKIDEHWAESVPAGGEPTRVGLASWVFDMVSWSMGIVFWGEEGPFGDAVFRRQLRSVPTILLLSSILNSQNIHPEPGSPAKSHLVPRATPPPLSTGIRP